jgi:hypothetical protein
MYKFKNPTVNEVDRGIALAKLAQLGTILILGGNFSVDVLKIRCVSDTKVIWMNREIAYYIL